MKRSRKRIRRIPLIGDMFFSMLSLPMALSVQEIISSTPDNSDLYSVFAAAMLFMGIARLFRAFRFQGENLLRFVQCLVYGILLVLTVPLMGVMGESHRTLVILGSVYWFMLIADRIISILRNHSLRNIILNMIALFLLIFLFVMFIVDTDVDIEFIMIVMFVAACQALLSIMTVAFSRINLRVLGNVIRQSYATEVLLGLGLLIISFSYCLKAWEPAMKNLGDAMWYCFAIVTTIGFGDITAVTVKGRVLSVILGMYGIIVVSLITSIIVNFYGEMKRENTQEDN